MPKDVSELPSGASNERNTNGGDSSERVWRIILNAPDEAYDIQSAVGVSIGDPHPVNTGVPCVGISERSDGDSRLVRLVTATYQTTPGSDQNEDPNLQQPEDRPAKWTASAALMEVPVTKWRPFEGNAASEAVPAQGPSKDSVEGLTKLVPVISVRIEQPLEETPNLENVGTVNSDAFQVLGIAAQPHFCMCKGIDVQPHVEARGNTTWRGYMATYDFAIRRDGVGWDVEIPQTGFNIINDGLGNADVEKGALNLELTDAGRIKGWDDDVQLADKTDGNKMRAMVLIAHPDGGASQRPSASPVALNDDGTPRSISANPPVLLKRYSLQDKSIEFGNNFAKWGIRWP